MAFSRNITLNNKHQPGTMIASACFLYHCSCHAGKQQNMLRGTATALFCLPSPTQRAGVTVLPWTPDYEYLVALSGKVPTMVNPLLLHYSQNKKSRFYEYTNRNHSQHWTHACSSCPLINQRCIFLQDSQHRPDFFFFFFWLEFCKTAAVSVLARWFRFIKCRVTFERKAGIS